MSTCFYVICAIVVSYCAWQNLIPVTSTYIFLVAIAINNLMFYGIFRSGRNRRWKDPSLTMPQIVMAMLLILYASYHGGEARGSFIIVYFIAFVFGCFRLTPKEFVWLCTLAIVSYGSLIPLLYYFNPAELNLRLDLMRWLTLAAFLPFLAVLASSISQLRMKLNASNNELQKAMVTISELATHDELTGLYNRRYILEVMKHEKNRTDRGGGSFCVCMLDLDHFKQINDKFGHNAGDVVLKAVANAASSLLRTTDFLGRWGGEEFILMLPNTSLDLALICTQRIHEELSKTSFDGQAPSMRVTASIGVAQYYLPEEISELIERADKALYKAKASGRNRTESNTRY